MNGLFQHCYEREWRPDSACLVGGADMVLYRNQAPVPLQFDVDVRPGELLDTFVLRLQFAINMHYEVTFAGRNWTDGAPPSYLATMLVRDAACVINRIKITDPKTDTCLEDVTEYGRLHRMLSAEEDPVALARREPAPSKVHTGEGNVYQRLVVAQEMQDAYMHPLTDYALNIHSADRGLRWYNVYFRGSGLLHRKDLLPLDQWSGRLHLELFLEPNVRRLVWNPMVSHIISFSEAGTAAQFSRYIADPTDTLEIGQWRLLGRVYEPTEPVKAQVLAMQSSGDWTLAFKRWFVLRQRVWPDQLVHMELPRTFKSVDELRIQGTCENMVMHSAGFAIQGASGGGWSEGSWWPMQDNFHSRNLWRWLRINTDETRRPFEHDWDLELYYRPELARTAYNDYRFDRPTSGASDRDTDYLSRNPSRWYGGQEPNYFAATATAEVEWVNYRGYMNQATAAHPWLGWSNAGVTTDAALGAAAQAMDYSYVGLAEPWWSIITAVPGPDVWHFHDFGTDSCWHRSLFEVPHHTLRYRFSKFDATDLANDTMDIYKTPNSLEFQMMGAPAATNAAVDTNDPRINNFVHTWFFDATVSAPVEGMFSGSERHPLWTSGENYVYVWFQAQALYHSVPDSVRSAYVVY